MNVLTNKFRTNFDVYHVAADSVISQLLQKNLPYRGGNVDNFKSRKSEAELRDSTSSTEQLRSPSRILAQIRQVEEE